MRRICCRLDLRLIPFATILLVTGLIFVAPPARAQIASSLLNEGDLLPGAGSGHEVTSLSNTAVNHVGGFALSINSSDTITTLSHIWGNAAGGAGDIIRTEGTFGNLIQTSYESFYGIDDSGAVAYSASGTGGPAGGFDSVWKDDTPVAVEGEPVPSLPGVFWSFASRPGISADGIPYFIGGTRDTPGGTTQNRGLFFDMTTTPLLLGGDLVPNLPDVLDTSSTVSFDYRFSALTSHYIAEVQFVGSSTANNAIVIDSEGLMLGGTLVAEGNPIPAGVGGQGGESWDNFDFAGHTESGEWFFTGDTNGATTADEIIVKNGMIVLREGDMLGGETLSGAIEGAYMNDQGDLAFIWDIQANALEALFLNDMLLLQEGGEVDLDGDGAIDPGAVIANFTGISSLTLSDRDPSNDLQVYFTADVDTAGTSSSSDDIEGFYCIVVHLGSTAVELSSFEATADPLLPRVTLGWSTSVERDHAGFNIHRRGAGENDFAQLNDGLVQGENWYVFVDDVVEPSTTYEYRLGAVDLAGEEEFQRSITVATPAWGRRTLLLANVPNPLLQRTDFRFSLAASSRARVTIYDVTGRLVSTVVDADLPAGEHTIRWNRHTVRSDLSAGGVYFYRLQTADGVQTRKMVLTPLQ